ncbi:Cytochrome P450 [Dillenia turbinata]|uniref:Cytochrome P450 n=1 Tax=Dillenia turbinata TaxID=194707 RepID=A0AAN8Z7J9_9MAGN
MNSIIQNLATIEMTPVFPLVMVIVVLASFSLIFLIHNDKCDSKCSTLPPGNSGWPFIGESLELLKFCSGGCPEKFILDRMNKFSSHAFRTSLLGQDAVVFCGSSGNKFLFSNENKLVKAWWPRSMMKPLFFPTPMTTSTNEFTKKMRGSVHEFLNGETLQQFIGLMDAMEKEHLEIKWSPYGEVEVFPLMRKFNFTLACRLFMGVNDPNLISKMAEPFLLVSTGFMSLPINFPGTAYNHAMKGGKILREEVLKIVRQRKAQVFEKKLDFREAKDLLSRMLYATDENNMFADELEIANTIISLLNAGNEPISATISFVLKYLAELPHIYDEVLKEQMEIAMSKRPGEWLNWKDIQKMKYTWNVVSETMRIASPAHGAFREVISDFTFAGFTIPKGWKAVWTTHSTHKNPKYFPNPEKFEPSRFEGNGPAPYTYVPFGGGPRMCPGIQYTQLQVLSFIHNVVIKFKWEKHFPNEKITYRPLPCVENGLPIRLLPHQT